MPLPGLVQLVQCLQVLSGLAWLVPMVLFAPAVWRIWRSPISGPSRPDPVDVLVSPLLFIAALQAGFVVRWIVFPGAIVVMANAELIVWAGLYTLSVVGAVLSIVAWRIARGIR